MRRNIVSLFVLLLTLSAVSLLNAQKQKDPVANPYVIDTETAIINGTLDRCGIDAILERIYNDPILLKEYEDNKKPLQDSRFDFSRINCNAANTIDIPLAFHFDNSFDCGDSACILSEIQDAIDSLNEDFGDNTGSANAANCPAAYPDISTGTCINFYLAAPPACSNLDTACDGAITFGQFQGGYNATGGSGAGNCWDDYLNVFVQSPQANNLGVSDQIPGYLNAAGPGEGVSLGAPYFGGNGGPCAPFDTDATYNGGSTLAHEIGHYLGLPHIWGDVNGGGCGGDDGFADTPNQQQQYFGCPTGCVASGCGGSQQTANFMNYTNDNCMDLFTEDQAATMNFYANQFFGGLNIPPANPAELYAQCTGNPCVITCPAVATSTYSDTDAVCAANGTYTLPTTYPGLTLDDPAGATYTWSTGGYLPGGTAVSSPYALTNPTGCNPSTETLYLNVSCATDNSVNINGGTLVLSVYPDPSLFATTDLASVTGENTCNEPILTPLCPEVTITSDAANPAFPVSAGQSGTANYTLTYTPAAGAPNCCNSGGGVGSELITNGDFEAGTTGWTETEEVPSGTPNPNPFGIIGVSNGPVNGSNDAWFGGWGGTSTLTISQNITIPATCSEANLTFDFSMSCAGDAGITLDVVVNGVVLGTLTCTDGAAGSITPFDLIAAGAPTGPVTISFVGTEDGTGTDAPDIYLDNISVVTANCAVPATCDFTITADYDCAGCTNCNNATCTTTQACNDNDPCTTNDEETILSSDGSVCVPCAGTAIASCSGSTSVVACNDGDTCTTNDVQTVDDCDGSVCMPCAGTAIPSCSGSTTAVNCNDGNPCTTNDVRMVDDCDGSVCVPCTGTLNTSSCANACSTTQTCNDGDPCTTNDMETVAADGSICVPCAGTAIASCSGSTSVVTCNDGDTCTTNDVQTVDDCDGSICVPCAGTAIASCSGSTSAVNCNDGNPCTINDVRMVDDCDGSVCVPCAGTVNASSCAAACSTTQTCNDGDPCTINDQETVAADGSICVPCAGTVNASSCAAACSTTQTCNDGDPCTTNDMETVAADGSICVPCVGTVNASSCAAACSTTQTCNDGDPCTTNDQETVAADGSICVPCAGTVNASSCNAACTATQSCNDNNPCTTNDIVILASNGSVCVPCAGTLNTASCNAACTTTQSCNDGDSCTTNDQITLAANGSICAPCAGTVNTTSCNASCTTTQSCNDNNPCTSNDVVILAANGSVCTPCAGTLNTASCNAACTTTQSCNDGDVCTTNDVIVLAANGSVCAPCAGTINTTSCNASCTTTQPCDDGDDCTINDQITLAASGAVCAPCAGTPEPSACCSNVNMSIFFDGFPGQSSWDIMDSNGNVVASSGSYSGQSPNSQMNITPAVCLSDGCYTLNFYDSLNNGMCPFQSSAVGVSTFITPGTLISPGSIVGTLSLVATPGLCGNYNLTDANGTSLASGGGSFGSQQIKTFCLNNGLAPRYSIDDNIDKFTKAKTSIEGDNNVKVEIMPNPVTNFMTVHHNMNTEVDIKIIDLAGKTVLANSMNQLDLSTSRIDVSNLKAGVYFIHLSSNENTRVEKFIKE